MLSVFLLFHELGDERENSLQSWRTLGGGVTCAVLAIYSLGNGLIYAVVITVVFAVFKVLRTRRSQDFVQRRRETLQLLSVSSILILAIALWFAGWHTSVNDVPRTSFFSSDYWVWFFSIASSGFGFQTYSFWAGIACLVFAGAPLFYPLLRRREELRGNYCILLCLTIGLLLALLSITGGRTKLGLESSKTPRYTEFTLLLLPSFVAGWWLMLQHVSQLKRRVVTGALWLFCVFSFWNDWSYFRYYSDKFMERQAGLECVADYYKRGQGKEWRCRSIAPFAINKQLDNAQQLNASFARAENLESRILRDTIRNQRP